MSNQAVTLSELSFTFLLIWILQNPSLFCWEYFYKLKIVVSSFFIYQKNFFNFILSRNKFINSDFIDFEYKKWI